jgi:uncharacterized membrane protein
MAAVTESVDVAVPVRTAYNQWTQFEDFPMFMEGVEEVVQLGDTQLKWVAEVSGKRQEWTAQIVEQRPDQEVAWRAIEGKGNSGVVTFEPLGAEETRITVQLDWQPEGVTENVGAAIGLDDRQVARDLDRFKELIESRGSESGAWRGEVAGGTRVDTDLGDTAMGTTGTTNTPGATADDRGSDGAGR